MFFVRAHCKGFADAFFASAHSAGLSSKRQFSKWGFRQCQIISPTRLIPVIFGRSELDALLTSAMIYEVLASQEDSKLNECHPQTEKED
jgi:hypothetical protein